MGGEKLKACRTVFLAVFFTVTLIFISIPVFAQNADNSGSSADTSSQNDTSYQNDTSALQEMTDQQGTAPAAPISEDSIILGETPVQSTTGSTTSIWIILRMVLVLALAALAIYGVVFFIKRAARPPQAKDPHLKILASIPLGSDSFAAIISVGTKAWLVGGGTGAGLSLITEIDDQETVETMLLDDANKNSDTGTGRILDFRALLNRFGSKNTGPRSEIDSHLESLRKQRDRLKGL